MKPREVKTVVVLILIQNPRLETIRRQRSEAGSADVMTLDYFSAAVENLTAINNGDYLKCRTFQTCRK